MTEISELLPIVVDTNIFLHLVDSRENADGHIHHLLLSIARTHELYIDKAGEIEREYKLKLIDVIQSLDETGFERYILTLLIVNKPMKKIEIEPPDNLRKAIQVIINDITKKIDRCLVETAALSNCDLITNDKVDILNNASQLKKVLKKHKYKKTNFIDSRTAYSQFMPNRDE